MTDTAFDVDHFIAKFEAIPADKWIAGKFVDGDGCGCALGHCGFRDAKEFSPADFVTDEGRALLKVLPDVILINDGWQIYAETGETPRDRVLSALYDVKLAQKAEAEVAAFDTEAGQ